jgi:hypothetical protein
MVKDVIIYFKELSPGEAFKFKRGRKTFQLSHVEFGCIYYYHDQSGIEHSVDISLFPTWGKKLVTIQ